MDRRSTSAARAVIVGSGYIAARHADALRDAGVAIGGVWSPSEKNAAAFANHYATTHAPTLTELLETPGATHLHVCGPTTTHAAPILAGLEAGLTIVSEKPLTTDGARAAELAAAAAASPAAAYVTFNRRYDGGIQRMRELVASDAIGRPMVISGSYRQQWNADPSSRDWRFDPELIGPSRVVSEIGSHWFDLAEHVTGLGITAVIAQLSYFGERRYQQGDESGVFTPVNEDAFSALLRFEGELTGIVHATEMAHGAGDDIALRVDGTLASVSWTSAHPGRVALARKEHGITLLGDTSPTTSIEDMIASLYAGDDRICATFADAAANCAVQDAVLDSAASGDWTTVRRSS